MKFVIFAMLAAVAAAAPDYTSHSREAAILRDDRVIEDDGTYNFNMESSNGIVVSESGAPGAEGAIASSGYFSYTSPEGVPVHVKFVADANGFQPESDLLPVAPAFPHPIPQFVLDQIAFAAEEDAARARGKSAPSGSYGSP
ncbi:cuticle protein AMP1A-like [Panulirus ornatus]|uniref:cuticle protein AMP1A-like n=1 Tax=Panulirus ornatus TaxID=150431 RepID=UPI003A887BEC